MMTEAHACESLAQNRYKKVQPRLPMSYKYNVLMMSEWDSEADCDNASHRGHAITSWTEDEADSRDD